MIPRHVFAVCGDVIALEPRNWHGGKIGDANAGGKGRVIGNNRVVDGLVIANQVHLIHRQHHVFDANQFHQIAVAARLGEHPFARVNQDNRHVGGGCACDHIAGVLLVSRCVGHDKLALFGGEKAVGHINGNALFPLGRKAIYQKRKVNFAALGAHLFAVSLQCCKLVFKDHLAVIQKAANQGGFAVINRTAGDKPQHGFMLVHFQIGVDIRRDQIVGFVNLAHQKYPSCFFFSIDAAWSLSIARPCRSDVVVSSISWITSGRVLAVLSTAPVSG